MPSSPIQLVGHPSSSTSTPKLGQAYSDLGTAIPSTPSSFPTMRNGLVHEWYTDAHVPSGSVHPIPDGDPSYPILSVMGFDRWREHDSQCTFGMVIVMTYGVYVVGSYSDGVQQSL